MKRDISIFSNSNMLYKL